ncbi:MAG: hypothetical protein A3J67_03000 [Parcubacteria group bacterium RIFCSPHIGHO2_02_FULL_48_10b]|nr:MAG: hypothetical protein A3J67_03000 [Parcubacteria group bacterium RIFCSPHIGHO2_02_FULL_48_10b]
MSAKKGSRKRFDVGVITAILNGKRTRRLDNGQLVSTGDVNEVNEHLFPHSAGNMGLLVASFAFVRSRPEILRQRPQLKQLNLPRVSANRLRAIFGNKFLLVSTGR